MKIKKIVLLSLILIGFLSGCDGCNNSFMHKIGLTFSFSELKTEDIKVGTGDEVKSGDTVMLHVKAEAAGLGVYEDTRKNDMPFALIVGKSQVIEGVDKSLLGMKVGGIRKMMIPPSMAYGALGSPGKIPPNSSIKYEAELLRILNEKPRK